MKNDRNILDLLKEDVRRGDFRRTVSKDFTELKEFMLDDERRERLSKMSPLKRWFCIIGWLLKSLFFRLTPARRIFLIVGLLLLFVFQNIDIQGEENRFSLNLSLFGGLAVLFVLMLELKDKLVAREELEAGHAVQKALMPERSPEVKGWSLWLFSRSANEVGGDLVDFMKLPEEKFTIALADVAGKGLSAALLTAKLQATIRALAPDYVSLNDLAAKLNQIFVRDSLPNLFASLVFVEGDCNSGNIELINAGHLPPALIRGNKIEQMEKGGAALGILRDAKYTEQKIALQKGDTLFLYSDGLTEARNAKGDFYGEQSLLRYLTQISHLSTDQMGEKIMTEIDRFIGEAKAHDDISIAILRKE